MPGGKIPSNGFMMFMIDFRKEQAKYGIKFASLEEVVPAADPHWRKLTSQQKAAYKNKAKEYKSSDECRLKQREMRYKERDRPPKPKSSKKISNNSLDESFEDDDSTFFFDRDEPDSMRRRREEDKTSFKYALTWNLGVNPVEKLMNESFLVLAVQNYFETSKHECQPAEFALVEFSLARGIQQVHTCILKPIGIPFHYRTFVQNNGKLYFYVIANSLFVWAIFSLTLFNMFFVCHTHMINSEYPPASARNDYRPIVDSFKRFYVDGKQKQNQFRAFVLFRQFNSVQGAVKALRDKTGSTLFFPQDKISCVEDLFSVLMSFKEKTPSRGDIAGFSKLMDETPFDFEPTTLCAFHKLQQKKHCALAIAKKTCYYLFHCLEKEYDITVTAKHIPPIYDEKGNRKQNFNFEDDKDLDEYIEGPYADEAFNLARKQQQQHVQNDLSSVSEEDSRSLYAASSCSRSITKNANHFENELISRRNLQTNEFINNRFYSESMFRMEDAEEENRLNEATASAPRPKHREAPVLTGVRWEPGPVFDERTKLFVPNEVERRLPEQYEQPLKNEPVWNDFSDLESVSENVFDDNDNLEAPGYSHTLHSSELLNKQFDQTMKLNYARLQNVHISGSQSVRASPTKSKGRGLSVIDRSVRLPFRQQSGSSDVPQLFGGGRGRKMF